MVKDHQRAEDVTQEVFVSALRRMRATERPIAFKPWIYEIAKNACIDQFRRSKRAEEVSFDADEGLAPSDYTRLVSREPVPDAALAAKQQLDDLCGAFGGLSDAHHEILVLRELEGLSYREIGERMGMSRPAVESTLFRARRRLTEEYDELASGERCLRIQSIISTAGSGRLGARDTRRLARHVAHCQPCRREAVAAGVDAALLARRPMRERAIEKVAALFPFPLLLRSRREGGSSDGWLSQLPVMSDHAATGGAKLAAVAALVVAGLGAGVGTHVVPTGRADGHSSARPTRTAPAASKVKPAAAPSSAHTSAPAASSSKKARTGVKSRSRAAHDPLAGRHGRAHDLGRRQGPGVRRAFRRRRPGLRPRRPDLGPEHRLRTVGPGRHPVDRHRYAVDPVDRQPAAGRPAERGRAHEHDRHRPGRRAGHGRRAADGRGSHPGARGRHRPGHRRRHRSPRTRRLAQERGQPLAR